MILFHFRISFFLVIFNRKVFYVLWMKFKRVSVEVEHIFGRFNPMKKVIDIENKDIFIALSV